MAQGKYENVAKAEDVQFADPTKAWAGANTRADAQYTADRDSRDTYRQNLLDLSAERFNLDPDAYMRQFLGQTDGLSNAVSGNSSALQQTLNGIANREAQLGGEAALASLGGGRNSGAGMASFGQAYADPFARAQAQIQQNQFEGTMGLYNNALGLNSQQQMQRVNNQIQQQQAQMDAYGNIVGMYDNSMNNALGQQVNLANNASGVVAPQYEAQKTWWDYLREGVGMAGDIGKIASGFNMMPEVAPPATTNGAPNLTNQPAQSNSQKAVSRFNEARRGSR